MHPWHEIELGEAFPHVVPAFIEVPKGSQVKYELHKKSGFIQVDRILFSAVHYPANYGFIPKTYCDDNDPLDILVLGQAGVYPGCIMRARPIGVIKMVDGGKADDKIISVHADDPEFNIYYELSQLPPHILKMLERFFKDYKILEHKEVKIENFLEVDEAKRLIREAQAFYESVKTTLEGYPCTC